MKQLALGLELQTLAPPAQSAARAGVTSPNLESLASPNNDVSCAQEAINAIQLERLAIAVLSKGSLDLLALAETNPALVDEWQAAFHHQHREAERSARKWASAAASLATIKSIARARKELGTSVK